MHPTIPARGPKTPSYSQLFSVLLGIFGIKHLKQGEKLNEEIMQSEKCMEEGILTNKLKYSLYSYLSRCEKIIIEQPIFNDTSGRLFSKKYSLYSNQIKLPPD